MLKIGTGSISAKEPDRIFVKGTLAHVPHLFLCSVIYSLYFQTRAGSTDYCIFAGEFIQGHVRAFYRFGGIYTTLSFHSFIS